MDLDNHNLKFNFNEKVAETASLLSGKKDFKIHPNILEDNLTDRLQIKSWVEANPEERVVITHYTGVNDLIWKAEDSWFKAEYWLDVVEELIPDEDFDNKLEFSNEKPYKAIPLGSIKPLTKLGVITYKTQKGDIQITPYQSMIIRLAADFFGGCNVSVDFTLIRGITIHHLTLIKRISGFKVLKEHEDIFILIDRYKLHHLIMILVQFVIPAGSKQSLSTVPRISSDEFKERLNEGCLYCPFLTGVLNLISFLTQTVNLGEERFPRAIMYNRFMEKLINKIAVGDKGPDSLKFSKKFIDLGHGPLNFNIKTTHDYSDIHSDSLLGDHLNKKDKKRKGKMAAKKQVKDAKSKKVDENLEGDESKRAESGGDKKDSVDESRSGSVGKIPDVKGDAERKDDVTTGGELKKTKTRATDAGESSSQNLATVVKEMQKIQKMLSTANMNTQKDLERLHKTVKGLSSTVTNLQSEVNKLGMADTSRASRSLMGNIPFAPSLVTKGKGEKNKKRSRSTSSSSSSGSSSSSDSSQSSESSDSSSSSSEDESEDEKELKKKKKKIKHSKEDKDGKKGKKKIKSENQKFEKELKEYESKAKKKAKSSSIGKFILKSLNAGIPLDYMERMCTLTKKFMKAKKYDFDLTPDEFASEVHQETLKMSLQLMH